MENQTTKTIIPIKDAFFLLLRVHTLNTIQEAALVDGAMPKRGPVLRYQVRTVKVDDLKNHFTLFATAIKVNR